MRKFKIESTELPVVWLGTSLFAGAGEFGEKAAEYHSRFYQNAEAMVGLMDRAAQLGWGVEALAMPNIIKAMDQLKKDHPKVAVAYTCGIESFVAEVNSALKRQPKMIFLHPGVTDTSSADEIKLYFRRVVEEWMLPAAATLEPLKAAAKLEGTGCRVLLVPARERGAELEHAVETVQKYGFKYMAEVQPVGDAKDVAAGVLGAVRANVDALVLGVAAAKEFDVYMRALEKMGFLS